MYKWKTPMGRESTLPDKGNMVKMFEPWQSRSDSENATFNTAMFSKWYNGLIDAMQRLRIPQELLNCNKRNISFNMNQHHALVWSRHVSKEYFHSKMLLFYLDEEAFNKEVMLWLGVKHNPHKLGMHYILPNELLNKKGKKVGVGPSLGSTPQKQEAPKKSYSEEEDEM
jgi:hypothetical protein